MMFQKARLCRVWCLRGARLLTLQVAVLDDSSGNGTLAAGQGGIEAMVALTSLHALQLELICMPHDAQHAALADTGPALSQLKRRGFAAQNLALLSGQSCNGAALQLLMSLMQLMQLEHLTHNGVSLRSDQLVAHTCPMARMTCLEFCDYIFSKKTQPCALGCRNHMSAGSCI